jgi:hypothetical protein
MMRVCRKTENLRQLYDTSLSAARKGNTVHLPADWKKGMLKMGWLIIFNRFFRMKTRGSHESAVDGRIQKIELY